MATSGLLAVSAIRHHAESAEATAWLGCTLMLVLALRSPQDGQQSNCTRWIRGMRTHKLTRGSVAPCLVEPALASPLMVVDWWSTMTDRAQGAGTM